MKCVCTRTCQFRGVTFEGEVREVTAEEFERPFVKAHFRVVGIADETAEGIADGAAIGKTQTTEGAGKVKRAKAVPSLELK